MLQFQNRPRDSSLPESHISFPTQLTQGFFRTANAVLSSAELVAYAHQDLTEAFALPGREHEDAGEVVIVPAHFLFAVEANDLRVVRASAVRSVDEEIVIEGGDIEEDGLVVEEEFCKEGEILGEELECDGQRHL